MSYTIEQLRVQDTNAWNEAAQEISDSVISVFESEANGNRINEEDLEEIASESAKHVHNRISKIESTTHLHRSARKFAQRRLLDHVRKVTAQKRGGGKVSATGEFHDLNENEDWREDPPLLPRINRRLGWSCFHRKHPAQLAETSDLKSCLDGAMAKLDDSSKSYIDYTYFHQFSNREIAKKMKVKAKSVSNRVKRAVEKLGVALGPTLRTELEAAYIGT